MHKLMRKVLAAWLAAFAITGATVWAAAEEETSEPEAASAEKDRAVTSLPHHRAAD